MRRGQPEKGRPDKLKECRCSASQGSVTGHGLASVARHRPRLRQARMPFASRRRAAFAGKLPAANARSFHSNSWVSPNLGLSECRRAVTNVLAPTYMGVNRPEEEESI